MTPEQIHIQALSKMVMEAAHREAQATIEAMTVGGALEETRAALAAANVRIEELERAQPHD